MKTQANYSTHQLLHAHIRLFIGENSFKKSERSRHFNDRVTASTINGNAFTHNSSAQVNYLGVNQFHLRYTERERY
jgi:nitrous oxidase accessory protein NosD